MRGALSNLQLGDVLFDLDGTLVDSSEAHDRAFRTALAQVSEEAARDFVYAPHRGKTTRQTLEDIGLMREELVVAKQRAYREEVSAGRVKLFPGARELLAALARAGRRSFLVTGASGGSTKEVVARLGLDSLLAGTVTADDVTHGKPHPEPFERALREFGLQAEQSIAIEDAISGLQSARGAGLRVVGVHGLEGGDWTCATIGDLFTLLGLEKASLAMVIPAAGRGTRLGIDVPKLFAPLGRDLTVWSVLRARALAVAEHVHVVLSREAQPFFERAAEEDVRLGRASSSLQAAALGMGDAVFKGRDQWGAFDQVIVMWGDQVGISEATLRKVADALRASTGPTVVLPLVKASQPYVEYRFDQAGALTRVLQSREGDACAPEGLSDVGVFGLSVKGLVAAWEGYEALDVRGAKTREANFLPFLPYLSSLGWNVVRVEVGDPDEARGINTPDDLLYFQRKLEEGSRR